MRNWLVSIDGVAAGFLSSWPGTNGVGMVEDLYVHPLYRHRGLATALLAHRYRTLQFDLYGRGGSARPRQLAYDRGAYCRQIDALIEALSIDEPLFVIGQSLGGAIAASYAAARPARVWALSLHASAGYRKHVAGVLLRRAVAEAYGRATAAT